MHIWQRVAFVKMYAKMALGNCVAASSPEPAVCSIPDFAFHGLQDLCGHSQGASKLGAVRPIDLFLWVPLAPISVIVGRKCSARCPVTTWRSFGIARSLRVLELEHKALG